MLGLPNTGNVDQRRHIEHMSGHVVFNPVVSDTSGGYLCSVVNNGGRNSDVVIVCRELEQLIENIATAGIRRAELGLRLLSGEVVRAVCTLMRKNRNRRYVLRPLGDYQRFLRELYLAHRGDAKRRPMPVQILWLTPKL